MSGKGPLLQGSAPFRGSGALACFRLVLALGSRAGQVTPSTRVRHGEAGMEALSCTQEYRPTDPYVGRHLPTPSTLCNQRLSGASRISHCMYADVVLGCTGEGDRYAGEQAVWQRPCVVPPRSALRASESGVGRASTVLHGMSKSRKTTPGQATAGRPKPQLEFSPFGSDRYLPRCPRPAKSRSSKMGGGRTAAHRWMRRHGRARAG